MKANELSCKDFMIGDWVMVNDIEHTHPLQVAEIFKKSGAYYVTLYWDGMPDNVNPETLTADIDKVLPIPLTADVLEKNGFVKGYMFNNVWNYTEDYKRLVIVYTGEVFNIQDTLIEFKHVHKLQHILKICGIEKEIIL